MGKVCWVTMEISDNGNQLRAPSFSLLMLYGCKKKWKNMRVFFPKRWICPNR